MGEDDKLNIEPVTAPSQTQEECYLPEGHIAIATILAPTGKDGKTTLQFNFDSSSPFEMVEAIGMSSFTLDDIGKRVACTRVSNTNQIMTLGFLFEGNNDQNKALLESLVAHSNQSPRPENDVQNQTKIESKEHVKKSDFDQNTSELKSSEQDRQVFDSLPSLDNTYQVSTNLDNDNLPNQITLRANEEITLQCGESYLTLKSDGRIKLNGKYIHSRATKVQRVSGGSIKLN